MGNASPMIVAAIGAVIAIVVSFVTYPILQSAADTYYLEYTPHCELGGETFLRVYEAGADSNSITGTGQAVSESSGACTASTPLTLDDNTDTSTGVPLGARR